VTPTGSTSSRAGKVVQAGSYAELMSEPGLFADLAARQEI